MKLFFSYHFYNNQQAPMARKISNVSATTPEVGLYYLISIKLQGAKQ
jgi:hypothetical protein